MKKVMEKRRKIGENIIVKIDYKNVVLDFSAEIEFNNHEGCDEP